ncbi:MAG: DNA polymerase III subunit delta [Burkholderiales bacterium]|nr:DNA polymerase III subunit delta [Burkholderiales bacterium]
MLLRPDKLSAHLQSGLKPLYVVTGDEPLLALEAADAIRARAKEQGYLEREVLTVEAHFNWGSLQAASASLSLFASLRVLEIRIPTGKPGNEGAAALEAFCADLPPDTVSLVLLPKLDKRSKDSAWFSALSQAGVVIDVYPVDLDALPEWIARRLATQNQSADRETLAFLAESVEGNLLAAHQEIQKLGLLYPARKLTFDEVSEAVLNVSRFDVFQLGDAMLNGDAARAARILDGLRGEGVKPIPILGVLAWLTRSLNKAKLALTRGTDMSGALREGGFWGDRQNLARRALPRLSAETLAHAQRHAAEIDRMSKGLKPGDVWDELLTLVLGIAKTR